MPLILEAGLQLCRSANQQEWGLNCMYSEPWAVGVVSPGVLDWLTWWIGFVTPILYLGECSSGICDEASCINGGTCTAIKADSYICLCPLGFKGRHCEDGEKEASWWRFLPALLIHVDVICHQCTFSKAPYFFMGLMLFSWEGWENLFLSFFYQVRVSSSVKVSNQSKICSF